MELLVVLLGFLKTLEQGLESDWIDVTNLELVGVPRHVGESLKDRVLAAQAFN